ncbi:MAG: MMPL family transporter [Bdellovibrionales bacterium]|nr:MMPL family transporter [Bdellovibrionales bacterium]
MNKARLLLFLIFGVLLTLVSAVRPQKTSISTRDFIGSDAILKETYEDHLNEFPEHQELVVVLQRPDQAPWDSDALCTLRTVWKQAVSDLEGVSESFELFSLRAPKIQNETLFYPLSYLENCQGHHSAERYFLSEDRQKLLFLLYFDMDSHPLYGHFHPQQLQEAVKILKQALKDYTVSLSGNLMFEQAMLNAIQQSAILNGIFVLLLMFCFYVVFKSLRAVFLFLVTLSFSSIPLFYLITVWAVPQDPLMTCLLMVISLATLEDFLLLSTQVAQIKSVDESPVTSVLAIFNQFKVPSFFTSLTTVIGFGPLGFSEVDSLRYFGVLVSIGVMLEWIAIFFGLPLFFKAFPRTAQFVESTFVFEKIREVSLFIPSKLVRKVSFVLFVLGIVGLPFVNQDHSPLKLLDEETAFIRDTRLVEEIKGGAGIVELVFPANLLKSEKDAILQRVLSWPEVSGKEGFEDYLSMAELPEDLKTLVRREAKFSEMGRRFWSRHHDLERVYLFLKSSSSLATLELQAKIEDLCRDKCSLQGELAAFSEYTMKLIGILSHGALWSLTMVLLLIVLLMVHFRLPHAFLYAATAAWGPVTLIGLVSVTQFPINLTTVVLGAVAIGLAGDNAIQFIFAARKKGVTQAPKDLSMASFVSALFMATASFSFLYSQLPNIRHLGFYLISLFLLGFWGDVFLLRAALDRSR